MNNKNASTTEVEEEIPVSDLEIAECLLRFKGLLSELKKWMERIVDGVNISMLLPVDRDALSYFLKKIRKAEALSPKKINNIWDDAVVGARYKNIPDAEQGIRILGRRAWSSAVHTSSADFTYHGQRDVDGDGVTPTNLIDFSRARSGTMG